MKEKIFALAKEFSASSHGSSAYDADQIFVMGADSLSYVPLSFITRKYPEITEMSHLQSKDFVYSSSDFLDSENFQNWYKNQFGKKLSAKQGHHIGILHLPNESLIKSTVNQISDCFSLLRQQYIINNGKNMPVQLAEWYAKMIFGLKQVKSSSQRGFDFFNLEQKRVEVMVDWNDRSSPKGAKLKKSLVELSDYCIVVYINSSFLIRDLVYLDSNYILRKYSDKGHTIFLKDSSIADYFFSASIKHHNKIISKSALINFASLQLKAKLDSMSQVSQA